VLAPADKVNAILTDPGMQDQAATAVLARAAAAPGSEQHHHGARRLKCRR